ncbi:MAG TPA: hypothetical protein VF533_01465 [Solirubrobacteraceae bacterium]|jgi:hypothetical protein
MTPTETIHAPASPSPGEQHRPVEGYPSLRAAAALIGVNVSTLSRRADVERVRVGREDRVPAGEVVRLTSYFGKRRASRVAGELVERAARTDAQADIAREVDEALERYTQPPTVRTHQAFLAEARRLLPGPMVAQIEATLHSEPGSGHSTIGWTPPGD